MTDKHVAVDIINIHKDFILPQNKNSTFKQTVVNIVKHNKKVTQKVLDGVSFQVNKGDFFGIVGRNGSGKSTLLKLIAGVYTPTMGHININGGLTPFIELGVGFNPELSGRDNVYLNGALLGFNRKQMDIMYNDIVDFAELVPFMDQKLKNYSSGMQVRLAFSIAIKAKNEILIFDEVLAVGDEAFQRKCLNVFEQYKASGQTVILVTHDMNTVKTFCNRAALIENGNLLKIGSAREVADVYSRLNQDVIDSDNKKINDSRLVGEDIINIRLTNKKNIVCQSFNFMEDVSLAIDLGSLLNEKPQSIGINIFKQSGEHITGFNSRFNKIDDWKKTGKVSIDLQMNIQPGSYYFLIELFKDEGIILRSHKGPVFSIVGKDITWSGLTELKHYWR